MTLFYTFTAITIIAISVVSAIRFPQIPKYILPVVTTIAFFISMIVLPTTVNSQAGETISVPSYINGNAYQIIEDSIDCTSTDSSNCIHTFECYDANGISDRTSCPYATEETTYTVESTIGTFITDRNIATGLPFTANSEIPETVPTEASAKTTEVYQNLKNKIGTPVTGISQQELPVYLLNKDKKEADDNIGIITNYDKQNMIPANKVETYDTYKANKISYVNAEEYKEKLTILEEQLPNLNALAYDQYGIDFRIIVVPASDIENPEEYTKAVNLNWRVSENGLPRNVVTLIVGIEETKNKDTLTAKWVTTFAGSQDKNEAYLEKINFNLTGVEIDEYFLGGPIYDINTGERERITSLEEPVESAVEEDTVETATAEGTEITEEAEELQLVESTVIKEGDLEETTDSNSTETTEVPEGILEKIINGESKYEVTNFDDLKELVNKEFTDEQLKSTQKSSLLIMGIPTAILIVAFSVVSRFTRRY